MPTIRPRPTWNPLMLLALLGFASVAYAQPPIEKQMTPEQFKAAGLEKLSPAELATLDAWLDNALEVATVAKEKVETERTPINTALKGEFQGWQNGTLLELENGQTWRVIDSEFLATRRQSNPKVTISPGVFGSWYMLVEGTSVKAKVKRVGP